MADGHWRGLLHGTIHPWPGPRRTAVAWRGFATQTGSPSDTGSVRAFTMASTRRSAHPSYRCRRGPARAARTYPIRTLVDSKCGHETTWRTSRNLFRDELARLMMSLALSRAQRARGATVLRDVIETDTSTWTPVVTRITDAYWPPPDGRRCEPVVVSLHRPALRPRPRRGSSYAAAGCERTHPVAPDRTPGRS